MPSAGRSEAAIVTLFRSRARIQCPQVRIVGIPNAAKRGQKAMNAARREGAAWGFPDMVCLWPERGIAFIEFKREHGGRLSLNQVEWLSRLTGMDFPAIACNDPDRALEFLRECGAPFLGRAPTLIADKIPAHLQALQTLVLRCPTPESRKALIVYAGCCEAITPQEGSLLVSANQLETA